LVKLYSAEGHRVGVCGLERPAVSAFNFYELDVRDRQRTLSVFREFAAGCGIDLLICCAGINNGKPLVQTSISRVSWIFFP